MDHYEVASGKGLTMRISAAQVFWYQDSIDGGVDNGPPRPGSNKLVWHLQTDEGIDGVGWVGGDSLLMPAAEEMTRRIIGENPFCSERISHLLKDDRRYGRGGAMARVRSGIDIACWDIMAKVAGQPLCTFLGGYRSSVRVYVAGGFYVAGRGIPELVEEVEGYVAAGAQSFKMKIGGADLSSDLERVRAVRDALGDQVELMVDANGAYDMREARYMSHVLHDLDVRWFEEPLDYRDLDGLAELRAYSPIPIVTGEVETDIGGFRDAVRKRVADVLMPDAQNIGGITEWRRCAAIALADSIGLAPHGDPEIGVHLALATPNVVIVSYFPHRNELHRAMFADALRMNKDGTIEAPDRPGLGFTIDWKSLERYERAQIAVQ
jgi:D-arabinonate dehydratase